SSRRRHTRFSRDWSSDVCSSDLAVRGDLLVELHPGREVGRVLVSSVRLELFERAPVLHDQRRENVSDFEFVVQEAHFGLFLQLRSEERRVGKEGRLRRSPLE